MLPLILKLLMFEKHPNNFWLLLADFPPEKTSVSTQNRARSRIAMFASNCQELSLSLRVKLSKFFQDSELP